MKLYIFGSCSGTEPFENRHHTAYAFEINRRIYWFDAGESCSHTAYTMGIDLMRVSNVFISHQHIDHVGGLCNLLWTVRKLNLMKKLTPVYGDITVHMANTAVFDSVTYLLGHIGGGKKNPYNHLCCKISDGVILENPDVTVEAMHNLHLPPEGGEWRSYSFILSAEGKRIITSGDIKDISELAPRLSEGCDLLLMESGHHDPKEVCRTVKENGWQIGRILFFHHGRIILNDFDGTLEKCREIIPNVSFCNDRDVIEI